MDASLFKDRDIFQKCLENIQKEVSRSKEDFLQEHFSKYDDPSLPPVWKTMEVVSFGMLSKLYCNFSDVDVKKAVAHSFGLPQYLYLECIAVLRNLCAHHDRIWNKAFTRKAISRKKSSHCSTTSPKRLQKPWASLQTGKKNLCGKNNLINCTNTPLFRLPFAHNHKRQAAVLCGRINNPSYIIGCWNTEEIKGNGSATTIGGIVGRTANSAGLLSCFNDKSI